MKDVLLHHSHAWPHTSLCIHKAIKKWDGLFLHGWYFAKDNEVKWSFCDALWSCGRKFYNTGIQHLIQCWQKCVENERNSVEKRPHNCNSCMNHPCEFHHYCNYIFWEKIGGIISYCPSHIYNFMILDCIKHHHYFSGHHHHLKFFQIWCLRNFISC
jgi:hypothetical protein